jgi:Ca-activated chloride channel homolog
VLDNSGSMDAEYDQYYYDATGKRVDAYAEEGILHSKKMDSAKDAVLAILNQLREGDRFSVVLFNSNASLAKPMGPVIKGDMGSIRNNLLNVRAGGSTNLAGGIDMASGQFRNSYEINGYEYENRIMILSDAQPNTGDFSGSGLMAMVRRNADSRIYTTFIGIGVDFNSQLADEITKVQGANYYSVHSPREFRQRVANEFDCMVTPLVFNLTLNFESQAWRIEKVFGSPEADQASGQLMRINTLFPSRSEGGQTKGGLVLLKLRKMSSAQDGRIYIRVSYQDRNGRVDGSDQVVTFEGASPEFFQNSGIRKGVLLSRYAALLKNWMADERQHFQYPGTWNPCVRGDTGIVLPPEPSFAQWERQSMPLKVSEPYRRIFSDFARYFDGEMRATGDNTLTQELSILNTLSR